MRSKEVPAAVLPDELVSQTVMNQGLEILPALTSLKASISGKSGPRAGRIGKLSEIEESALKGR